MRIAIVGGPRTGKTTLADKLGPGTTLELHTDAFMDMGWSEASDKITEELVFHAKGRWVAEGVAMARVLRKMLKYSALLKPCDLVIVLRHVYYPEGAIALERGAEAMAKGVHTVLDEILLDLRVRGVVVIEASNV